MEKLKVLLVDDEEEFVKALADRIQMRDLGTDVALNGEQALQIVDGEVPDVMVLDLRMPGIDGMEVLRRVKKTYPKVEVIILTGHGSESDEREARKLGAFDYLQKPTSIDVLVQKLKEAGSRVNKAMEGTFSAAALAEGGDHGGAEGIMSEKD